MLIRPQHLFPLVFAKVFACLDDSNSIGNQVQGHSCPQTKGRKIPSVYHHRICDRFGAVIGGFVLEGGPIAVLNQTVEFLIIGGAAIGSLLAGTPTKVLGTR